MTVRLNEADKAAISALYAEAREQTAETIGEFVKKLTSGHYTYDYGSIVHATAAAALAAAVAIEGSSQGGMSGAQAGFVPMLFLSKWDQDETPMRVQRYKDMLFPQYAERFTTISPKMFAWLQEQAAEKLRESSNAAARVVKHWESIVAGHPPFGLQLTT